MRLGRILRGACACLAVAGLVACDAVSGWPTKQAPKSSARPEERPERPVAAVAPPPAPASSRPAPSSDSRALAGYYLRVQQELLAQGLLRTDGGGIDTPYSEVDLIRNFERIAFYDEYAAGGGLGASSGAPGRLKRWEAPVRLAVSFGASVPPEAQSRDTSEVQAYAQRLARITGHPIALGGGTPNFHVIFGSFDDRAEIVSEVRRIVPRIDAASLALFEDLPRSIHCFVIAFSGASGGHVYERAIAYIRAEHPPLLTRSCIHEEIAQGLGLANDSPAARPSIFNDDDEFALLTSHDEELLRLLYDPRLRPGMSLDEARPIFSRVARGQMGQAL